MFTRVCQTLIPNRTKNRPSFFWSRIRPANGARIRPISMVPCERKAVLDEFVQRCQIKFPNIHVSLLEMFTKSSCNLKIGSCRKPSESVGTEEINTKRQERELLFIFKFIVTILNNGSSLISSESSVSESQQSLFFSANLAFIFLQTAKWRRM